ncbi:HYC_CC_PP family protein [Hymenobacter jejuensis]|uniref:DUF2946 domain-containing protein n=1 Tax=Hymenobacter jejuensis TaxID=2502781 RepID=A0A5B7ZX64_9BACT|nr:hypothetical protein [Hymenobacter jejuensis]QDA59096.1 hypothetical protein FHG12_02790 [Hymenobacter jejuensis]
MKRPLSHRLFSAMLALLVLASSVGLTVLQHTCRESGRSTASVVFSTPHHRCPSPMSVASAGHTSAPHKAQLKGACCDFSTHFHKLDSSSPQLAWVKSLVPDWVAVPLPATCWPALPPAAVVAQATRWYAADSSPPPRAGRLLLAFVCTLVV